MELLPGRLVHDRHGLGGRDVKKEWRRVENRDDGYQE
jgi:hypothetical protein